MTEYADLSPAEVAELVAQAPPAVAAVLLALLDVVAQQQQTIASLTAQLQQLQDQNSRNSHNSHQPPASDGFKKQPRSLRTRSGKQTGGQPGHTGHSLSFSEQPDLVLLHRPVLCAGCGSALGGVPAHSRQRRQVLDLPPLQLRTTEHQLESVICPHCQQLNSASFPPEASEPLQYGPQLKALVVYLRNYQLLPSARTAELLADLFGTAPSEGTLDNIISAAASGLADVVERIRTAISAAAVAHFDETGCYVEDQRRWLHVACTKLLTFYKVDRRRGYEGSTAAGVLPGFQGTAMHDAYAAYWRWTCQHALCNAHLLRELLFVVERYGQTWAAALAELLREMLAATSAARAAGAVALPAEQLAAFEQRYDALVALGLAANPLAERPPGQQRGRTKQSTATNLALRLREHRAEVLRFVYDLRVPFDNNQAERDVRMMKVQQKIAGRFRTAAGAAAFCCIRSYISTLRKQGQHVFTALEQLFRGRPVLPASLA